MQRLCGGRLQAPPSPGIYHHPIHLLIPSSSSRPTYPTDPTLPTLPCPHPHRSLQARAMGIATSKMYPFETDIHVPFRPGIEAGTVLPQLAGNVDIAPTVLFLAGGQGVTPRSMDRRNMAPFLLPGLHQAAVAAASNSGMLASKALLEPRWDNADSFLSSISLWADSGRITRLLGARPTAVRLAFTRSSVWRRIAWAVAHAISWTPSPATLGGSCGSSTARRISRISSRANDVALVAGEGAI